MYIKYTLLSILMKDRNIFFYDLQLQNNGTELRRQIWILNIVFSILLVMISQPTHLYVPNLQSWLHQCNVLAIEKEK